MGNHQEVSNVQYKNFLDSLDPESDFSGYINLGDMYTHVSLENGQWIVDPGYEKLPMVEVTWYGAKAYCEWAGGALPTEAQWEKAARGNEKITYPWGNNGPSCMIANYAGCSNDLMPIGAFPEGASPYGVMEMAGNAFEWTLDWYGVNYYRDSVSVNPTGPDNGDYKVLRGGSWYFEENYLRVTDRYGFYPEDSSHNIGFRCVLPIDISNPGSQESVSDESGLRIEGDAAFADTLMDPVPVFQKPDGCSIGWLTSDPATLVFPDGSTQVFHSQFVIILEDVDYVQIENVSRVDGKASVYGVWYSPDLIDFVEQEAKRDFCVKAESGQVAIFYHYSEEGLVKLDTTASVDCAE